MSLKILDQNMALEISPFKRNLILKLDFQIENCNFSWIMWLPYGDERKLHMFGMIIGKIFVVAFSALMSCPC